MNSRILRVPETPNDGVWQTSYPSSSRGKLSPCSPDTALAVYGSEVLTCSFVIQMAARQLFPITVVVTFHRLYFGRLPATSA